MSRDVTTVIDDALTVEELERAWHGPVSGDGPSAAKINNARREAGRVMVVGTTTMRALESSGNEERFVKPGAGEATLTIKPGYRFRVADALLTNFHLPQSSLLILVSAFAGREFVLDAYRHAVRERYRFYSYGDCMLIL